MARMSTCSPTEGAHHVRERPARAVSHWSQSVTIPPVCTRQRPSREVSLDDDAGADKVAQQAQNVLKGSLCFHTKEDAAGALGGN